MNRLQNIALTLIGFGFVALGIFLMTQAETRDDLLMGGVTTMFFGACGLIGLIDLLPASRPRKRPDGCIVVTASRLRAGVFAFGGLAFMLAGGVMALAMIESGFSIKLLLGALGVPFGLGVLIFAGRQVFARGPLYVMDAAGIEAFTGIKWRLAWRDISEISIGGVGPNMFLVLETWPHVPDPPGGVAKFNRRFNMPPYAIATGTSGVDFGALTETVMELWEANRGPAAA